MWQQADDACSDCPVNYCEDYKDYRDIQGGYYLDISLHLSSLHLPPPTQSYYCTETQKYSESWNIDKVSYEHFNWVNHQHTVRKTFSARISKWSILFPILVWKQQCFALTLRIFSYSWSILFHYWQVVQLVLVFTKVTHSHQHSIYTNQNRTIFWGRAAKQTERERSWDIHYEQLVTVTNSAIPCCLC